MFVMYFNMTIVGFIFGWTLLMTFITMVYPIYKSIAAIDSLNDEDQKQWLSYWLLYCFSIVWEYTGQYLLSYILPFFWLWKFLYWLWLMMPQTRGALVTYHAVLLPIFKDDSQRSFIFPVILAP